MHPRSLTRFIASALAAATMAAASAKADDVNVLIKTAESAYASGNYSEAISKIDAAGQLLRQKKSEAIEKLLPEAPTGWTLGEIERAATSGATFGGILQVERHYAKEEASMRARITTDSPMLSSMIQTLQDPQLLPGLGISVEKINGQKAVVGHNSQAKQGEINVTVDGRILVTVTGSGASREDLVGLASKFDFDRVKALR